MPLAGRVNSLFMGTDVSNGTAVAVVVATGKATEFGRVSETLRRRLPETEFERGLRRFGYLLMEVTLLLILCVFGINVSLHRPILESFLFVLALAVGLTLQLLPANTPVNRSLVGAMSSAGLLTIMEVEGSIDGEAFFVFLQEALGPCLRPGDVVLMDNLSTHQSAHMSEAIHAHGAEVVFLPRYSPDSNPIEGAWSKLKAYLRKAAARTPKALDRALARGLARISASNARGWFQHAGYRTT